MEDACKGILHPSAQRWRKHSSEGRQRRNGEQLTVKNAQGTEENPVVIGSYGEGAKPVINGNGANWDADTKEELAAVHIYNSENIVIENLEITNWDETAAPGSGWTYGQSSSCYPDLLWRTKMQEHFPT